MINLKILVGIPGSGKSTYAKKELQKKDKVIAYISRDIIRFGFLDSRGESNYFRYEDEVFQNFIYQINKNLTLGVDEIIVDATHINTGSRMKLLKNLHLNKNINIIFEVFNTPLEVCLERNNLRKGRERIPDSALKNMQKRFSPPNQFEIEKIKTMFEINNIKINFHKED